MNDVLNPKSIGMYLSQGFVPDTSQATNAIEELLDWVDKHLEEVTPKQFDELVIEGFEKTDAKSWDVTLTGGLDSRFLLELLQQSRSCAPIACYTWGPPFSSDVKGAKKAAKGHQHTVLDTRSVTWNGDEISSYLKLIRPTIGMAMPRLDAVWLFQCLERGMSIGGTRVNGYLGDMLSGSHLKQAAETAPAEAMASLNRTGIETDFNAVSYYRHFCEDNADLIETALSKTAFTIFDLLDYSFRQRQRIHPVMCVSGKSWISPFNSPEVIVKWAITPISDRRGQKLYREKLSLATGIEAIRQGPTIATRVVNKIRRVLGPPEQMRNLANPIVNESLRSLMRSTCRDLDARNLTDISFTRSFQRLLAKPTNRDWKICLQGMSIELHARSM